MIDFYQVWHNADYIDKKAPSAKYLNLSEFKYPELKCGLDIQEYKVYQIPNEYFNSDNEYIGFASSRWSEKFPSAPTIEYLLTSFKSCPPKDRFWHSLITAQPHWIEHMTHFHKGLLSYILEGAGVLGITPHQLNNQALPMCNSFICRKDLFFEAKAKMNHMFDFYEQNFEHKFDFADNGYAERVLGCFYERVLMIVLASCNNVRFINPIMYWEWASNAQQPPGG